MSPRRVDLDDLADADEKSSKKKKNLSQTHQALVERVQAALAEQVKTVRVSSRLTDSQLVWWWGNTTWVGTCVVCWKPQVKPYLSPKAPEINPTHPLIARLDQEQDEARFADLAQLIYAQAQLAEGSQLQDPALCAAIK